MTNEDKILKKYKLKIKELKRHNEFYYNQDKTLISDAEYDKIKNEVSELEKKISVFNIKKKFQKFSWGKADK